MVRNFSLYKINILLTSVCTQERECESRADVPYSNYRSHSSKIKLKSTTTVYSYTYI